MTVLTTYDDLLARVSALAEELDRPRWSRSAVTGERASRRWPSGWRSTWGSTPTRWWAPTPSTRRPAGRTRGCGSSTTGRRSRRWCATPARGGGRLRYDYRWWTGETGTEDQPMPAVLLVEGIRLLSDRTRDWFDLTVWIDLDPDASGVRAVARNTEQGDDAAELDLWVTKWVPEGHAYAEQERPLERADVVVSPAG